MDNQTPAEGDAQAAAATQDAAAVPAASPTDGTHATTEAHGGEHSGAFPPFDASTFGTQVIWLAITFVVLYVVLARFALPRIGGILEDRKSRIDTDLAAADASRQKTDAAIAAYEEALAEARKKSHAIAEETRSGIQADLAGKRKAVEADMNARVAEAEARIKATKTEALGHVGEIAADTVETLVGQLVGKVSAEEARDAVAQVSKE